jgi:hypothetical protein
LFTVVVHTDVAVRTVGINTALSTVTPALLAIRIIIEPSVDLAWRNRFSALIVSRTSDNTTILGILTNVGGLAIRVSVASAGSLGGTSGNDTALTLPGILAVIVRGASRAHPPVSSVRFSVVGRFDTPASWTAPDVAVDTDTLTRLADILALIAFFAVVLFVSVTSGFTVSVEAGVTGRAVASVRAFKTVAPGGLASVFVVVGVGLAGRNRSSAFRVLSAENNAADTALANVGRWTSAIIFTTTDTRTVIADQTLSSDPVVSAVFVGVTLGVVRVISIGSSRTGFSTFVSAFILAFSLALCITALALGVRNAEIILAAGLNTVIINITLDTTAHDSLSFWADWGVGVLAVLVSMADLDWTLAFFAISVFRTVSVDQTLDTFPVFTVQTAERWLMSAVIVGWTFMTGKRERD